MVCRKIESGMTTERALSLAKKSTARRGQLVKAFEILAGDEETRLCEQDTNFGQAPDNQAEFVGLMERLRGMGNEHARAIERVLYAHPLVMGRYADLTATSDARSGKPTSRPYNSDCYAGIKPTREQIRQCMTDDGGSMDGFDPDYRAWVEDNADPSDVAHVTDRLNRYEDEWYR